MSNIIQLNTCNREIKNSDTHYQHFMTNQEQYTNVISCIDIALNCIEHKATIGSKRNTVSRSISFKWLFPEKSNVIYLDKFRKKDKATLTLAQKITFGFLDFVAINLIISLMISIYWAKQFCTMIPTGNILFLTQTISYLIGGGFIVYIVSLLKSQFNDFNDIQYIYKMHICISLALFAILFLTLPSYISSIEIMCHFRPVKYS